MIKKLLPLLLIIVSLSNLRAYNTYPYNLELITVERGGKLIPNLEKGIIKNYFFKPGWAGNTDIFSSWEGLDKNNLQISNLGNLNIFNADLFKNNFILIFEQSGKIFIALADKHFNLKQIKELHQSYKSFDFGGISLSKISQNIYCLLFENNLYEIILSNDDFKIDFISSNVSSPPVYLNEQIYFIKKNMFFQELRSYYQKKDTVVLRLQIPDYVKLHKLNSELILISGSRFSDNSWGFFIKNNKIENKINFQTSPDKIIFHTANDKRKIYHLVFKDFNYYLIVSELTNNVLKTIDQVELPKSITDLKKMEIIEDEIYLLFKNSLVIIDLNGTINAVVYLPFAEYFPDKVQIYKVKNLIYLSDFSNSIILKQTENNYWWFYYYYDQLGNYTILGLFIFLLLVLYRKYLKQKLISRTLLDLPSSGVVFIVDKNGKLTRVNEPARELLNITKDVPLKRLFTFYTDEKTEKLNNLVEKALLIRDGFREEVKIIDDDKFSEWVFTVYPLNNLLGNISSYIITGINISEELERKRIYNWAQLAHDMQTNLSTIKLNAEQLDCSNEEDFSRKKKILIQTNILIHKVRDIVTVGRTDELNLTVANSADICHSVKDEFDETLFPNIKLNFDCQNFNFKCDKAKILRALRNAIENGIKAIKSESGKIDITVWHDTNNVYFSIKDNGIGMTDKQLAKIKRPFYTSSKKEGGSGIGTMIIQNVVEQHGGELKYESKVGEGTEVIIKIPYLNENR